MNSITKSKTKEENASWLSQLGTSLVSAAIFKPSEFRRCFGEMLQARDVIWSWRDPLPFLLMTPMSWEILWPAMTSGLSLGEATQRDIAWFGGAP